MNRQYFVLLVSLFFIESTYSSFAEFYGTAPSTSAIGNQANNDATDPANLYYIPALSAFSKKLSLSATVSNVSHSFENINNIVTENSINGQTGSSVVRGDANTNYENATHSNVHILFPLQQDYAGAVGINFFAPVGQFAEVNTGHPFLPEYTMYRARYRRTQLHMNYAFKLTDQFSLSLGAHIGFQASARVNTSISLTDDYGSNANAKTKIDPSLAAIFSAAYRSQFGLAYFTFQQEMKSNLEAVATGDISDPPLTLINVGLESMIYYDPHILRFGFSKDFLDISLYASLEYQLWENYEAPTVKVANLGGSVRASSDYETLKLRNTFNPKVGLKIRLFEQLNLMAGLAYRQTPIDSDFSESGNSIDSDVIIASTGASYDFKFFGKDLNLGLSIQYHKLSEKSVTKTANQEDGSSGQKIGSGGYKIGGHVLMAMSGLKATF